MVEQAPPPPGPQWQLIHSKLKIWWVWSISGSVNNVTHCCSEKGTERRGHRFPHVKTRKQRGIPNFQTLTHAICPHKEAAVLTQHFVCKYSAVFCVFFYYSWKNQCESISSLLSGTLPLLTVTWIRWCFSICVFTVYEAQWVSCKAWFEVCFIF